MPDPQKPINLDEDASEEQIDEAATQLADNLLNNIEIYFKQKDLDEYINTQADTFWFYKKCEERVRAV